jgi:hypothetical protein
MVMFEVDQLDGARERARRQGVREVFELALEDIAEVHLHPADMRGAIVALSRPRPRGSWRWGGPDWQQRTAPLRVAGATIGVSDPAEVEARWETILNVPPASTGVRFVTTAPTAASGRSPSPQLTAGARR